MPPAATHSIAQTLARTLEEFLGESHDAVVIEDGLVTFDLANAKFSISTENDKCLLHLWSDERNIVRRVEDAKQKKDCLQLEVRKFGQGKPTTIEICRERDRRTPSAKKAARAAYQRFLSAVLQRESPGYKIEKLTSAADLAHSFGPAYARCVLRKGRSAFAVIGVNEQEAQATIDGALSAGLLWLEHCRQYTDRALVEGLRLFLPVGQAETVRIRMANLNHRASRFHLYEVIGNDGSLREADINDGGNIATRLVRNHDQAATRARFEGAIARVLRLAGSADEVEIAALSPGEMAFRWRGLEFARVRNALVPGSFSQQQQITFGAGAYETPLTEETEPFLRDLVSRMMLGRRPGGDRTDLLWHMQPERWLESLLLRDIQAIDARLDPEFVYRQVPAFAASDRAMIDLLTCTHDGRLAVIEVKASEDLHLPLQGLDYWARVNWHHQRGEFHKFGYFAGRELSADPPLLYLVAPALQLHPATDAQLKYLPEKIEWQVLGVNEDWRNGVRVIFRKSPK
jgi:hypothetical protein